MSKGNRNLGNRPTAKRSSEERGDISTQCLHRTIVVCGVALIGVLLFAFSPRKKAAATSAVTTRAESKAPAASFDRQSLSTKTR